MDNQQLEQAGFSAFRWMITHVMMSILLLLMLFLGYQYVKTKFELAMSQRAFSGTWRQIDDGHLVKTVVKEVFRTNTIILHDKGKEQSKYIPPEGEVTISPKDPTKKLDDVVNIRVRSFGFTFRPGLQLSLLPGGIGIDSKLAFYERWGLTVGAMYQHYEKDSLVVRQFSPTAGITYRLDRIPYIYNTEFVFGYAPLPLPAGYLGLRWGL